jgi:hypothetical protein
MGGEGGRIVRGGIKILDQLREYQRPKEPEIFGFSIAA